MTHLLESPKLTQVMVHIGRKRQINDQIQNEGKLVLLKILISRPQAEHKASVPRRCLKKANILLVSE